MTNLPALPAGSVLDEMTNLDDKALRAKAVAQGMKLVKDDRFARTVPYFLTELPWIGDDEDVQARIAAQLFLKDDPDKVSDDKATVASKNLVGQSIVIHDLRTNETDIDKGWGAYLLLDCTVEETGERVMVSTGAPQAIVRLAIGYARGELPLRGAFAHVGGTGRNGNPVITFIAEPDL